MAADHIAHGTPRAARISRRSWLLLALVVLLIALVVLPPYLSVSRFQRRITTSMSQVLGRPVHLDHVTLHLLPFPAFTIDNLVIDELPPFGNEPIIRANTVSARLRFRSLWLRRVEFSRITFTDPSINLVRNPDGRWNLESFLLQAAHINAAPTTQPRAGSTPRFPYIEVTGARINLKLAQRKTPFSLTEVELALWLPEPQQWKLRLRGRPARTDTGATDTGLLQTEATLERAGAVGQVPLTLDASWVGAPLGEASRVLTGTDAGIRGDLSLTAHVAGTLDNTALQLELKLNGLRRADFVPDRLIDLDLECRASATRLLHTLSDLHCLLPLPAGTRAELLHPGAVPAQLTLAGNVPDLLSPASAQLGLTAEHVPAATLLTWAHVASSRLAPGLSAGGELNGTATWPGTTSPATAELDLSHLTLAGGRLGTTPITFAPVTLSGATPVPGSLQDATLELLPVSVAFGRSTSQRLATPPSASESTNETPNPAAAPDPASRPSGADNTTDPSTPDPSAVAQPAAQTSPQEVSQTIPDDAGTLQPATLPGGTATLSGTATTRGYTAHLAGFVPLARLLALGTDVPSFGAGLPEILPTNRAAGPTRIDLSVQHMWGENSAWTNNLPASNPAASTAASARSSAPRKARHHR